MAEEKAVKEVKEVKEVVKNCPSCKKIMKKKKKYYRNGSYYCNKNCHQTAVAKAVKAAAAKAEETK